MINVQNLKKMYGEFAAVNDISFEVPDGMVFAFLGPNGAGKTTTIKMLTTLLKPSGGTISVGGHDPVTQSAAVRRSIGIVFQDPSLDDELTAWENLEFHGVLYNIQKEKRRKKIDEMLKFVDLDDRRDDLVKKFSGGMKRRLEIARGLMHEPRVLFLDEPTLGLDPQTRNHMWSYVKKLNSEKKLTVFFTTHYMEEAERAADQVAIVDHGKIVARGTVAELKAQTKTDSLEDAFLSLTGHAIRAEEVNGEATMRTMSRMWGRK